MGNGKIVKYFICCHHPEEADQNVDSSPDRKTKTAWLGLEAAASAALAALATLETGPPRLATRLGMELVGGDPDGRAVLGHAVGLLWW